MFIDNENMEGEGGVDSVEHVDSVSLEGGEIGDIRNEFSLEHQKLLFGLWFDSSVKGGPKRRSYKVPFRVTWLSCGCQRERTNEADPNNSWHVKRRKGGRYSHQECGGEISGIGLN